MAAIPPDAEQEIINRVYATYEAKEQERGLYLGRLGASFIGKECLRMIWLDWRAYARPSFEGRMLRLFETGHRQEERIIQDLRSAGLQVFSEDAEGNQYAFTDPTGHLVAKVDGVVTGVPGSSKAHLFEAKSHNKNSFSGFAKKKVLEVKPEHYTQTQMGMALGGFERGLYAAICKDDEKYYVERLHPDKPHVEEMLKRVVKLVDARLRPAGISDDGEAFGCKYCDMKEVCTGRAAPLRTCRSCRNSEPTENGSWTCNLKGIPLSLDEQKAACQHYEVL